jgi:uncharacterized protein YjbI with pentapeptide repeats
MRILTTSVGQEPCAPDTMQIIPDTNNVIPAQAGIQRVGRVPNGAKRNKKPDIRLMIYICCFLCCIAFSMPPVMAKDTTTVPLKDWWEYTEKEKQFLQDRWTREKVDSVVSARKEKKSFPDFVGRLSETLETSDTSLSLFSELTAHRPDLRGIKLAAVNLTGFDLMSTCLQGADLISADLQGANLSDADLRGANLYKANLQGALLWLARLQGANLRVANVQRAHLRGAHLDSANLWRADLQGADLRGASLNAADLLGARFDTIYLQNVDLGKAKNIRYIVWGDSLQPRYFIGEEKWADSTKTEQAFRNAEITYRDLKSFYEKELMPDIVTEFHFRENEVITKRLLWYWSWSRPWKAFFQEPWDTFLGIMRYCFWELTYGYGSRPWWLLWYSLGVIGLFTVLFYVLALLPSVRSGIYITKQGETRKRCLTWRHPHEYLYASLLAFATVGYGALRPKQWLQFFRMRPVDHEVIGWIRILVGIEAALGIWVLALLVTVLFGR